MATPVLGSGGVPAAWGQDGVPVAESLPRPVTGSKSKEVDKRAVGSEKEKDTGGYGSQQIAEDQKRRGDDAKSAIGAGRRSRTSGNAQRGSVFNVNPMNTYKLVAEVDAGAGDELGRHIAAVSRLTPAVEPGSARAHTAMTKRPQIGSEEREAIVSMMSAESLPVELQDTLLVVELLGALMGMSGRWVRGVRIGSSGDASDGQPAVSGPEDGIFFIIDRTGGGALRAASAAGGSVPNSGKGDGRLRAVAMDAPLSLSVVAVGEEILPLCNAHAAILRYCTRASALNSGLVAHALSGGLFGILDEHYACVAQLEAVLANGLSSGGPGGLTLSQMVAVMECTRRPMVTLHDLVLDLEQADAKGGMILDVLHETIEQTAGDAALQSILTGLMKKAAQPFLDMLYSCITTGSFEDVYGEFMISKGNNLDGVLGMRGRRRERQDRRQGKDTSSGGSDMARLEAEGPGAPVVESRKGLNSESYWEKCFVLRHEFIPSFLSKNGLYHKVLDSCKFLHTVQMCTSLTWMQQHPGADDARHIASLSGYHQRVDMGSSAHRIGMALGSVGTPVSSRKKQYSTAFASPARPAATRSLVSEASPQADLAKLPWRSTNTGVLDLGPKRARIVYMRSESYYEDWVNDAYQYASLRVLSLFKEEHKLVEVLTVLKHFYFMDMGDFIVQFLDRADSELSLRASDVSIQRLRTALHASMEGSTIGKVPGLAGVLQHMSCCLLPYTISQHLMAVFRGQSKKELLQAILLKGRGAVDGEQSVQAALSQRTGHEAIAFVYEAPWPLSLVLTKSTMLQYQLIFRTLLTCRLVVRQLTLSWVEHKITRALPLPLHFQQALSSCASLRQQMLCYVQNLAYFMSLEVIEQAWIQLMSRIATVVTLDDLVRAHAHFVERCVAECLLSNETTYRVRLHG